MEVNLVIVAKPVKRPVNRTGSAGAPFTDLNTVPPTAINALRMAQGHLTYPFDSRPN
jgi:hypothetical protein